MSYSLVGNTGGTNDDGGSGNNGGSPRKAIDESDRRATVKLTNKDRGAC